jgi:hypothetical protein
LRNLSSRNQKTVLTTIETERLREIRKKIKIRNHIICLITLDFLYSQTKIQINRNFWENCRRIVHANISDIPVRTLKATNT